MKRRSLAAILGFLVITFGAGSLFAQSVPCDRSAPKSRGANFTPDGKKIVFDSTRDGGPPQIYIMNSDGSGIKRLTHSDKSFYLPTVSPDGKMIVFMSYTEKEQAVYVLNIDGTGLKKLTGDSHDGDPAWSADSRKIVFHSNRDEEKQEIYAMDRDGRNVKRLTYNKHTDYVPRWSPNGKMISFNTTRDGNREIYVMSPDGSKQRNITNDPLSNMVHNWSPDSSKIIFYAMGLSSSHLKETNLSPGAKSNIVRITAEIYTIDLDGKNRVRLTNDFFWDQGPAYSPDGKRILFESCRSGNRETWIMNADGSDIKRLTYSIKSK